MLNVCMLRNPVRCTFAKYFNDFIMKFSNIKAGGLLPEKPNSPHEHMRYDSNKCANIDKFDNFESQTLTIRVTIVWWFITPSNVVEFTIL